MMIDRFTEKQIKILKALGRYKFLTYNQMKRLGIDNHSSNLSKECSGLFERKRPFAKKIPHGVGTPAKFYLTRRGAKYLVEFQDINMADLNFPKALITTDTQDQKHRTYTIDCHVQIDMDCERSGLTLLFCDGYFDKVGNNKIDRNLKSKTAFLFDSKHSIKADLVFMIQTPKQKELYLLEMENGSDTKKAVDKCIRHAKAIFKASVNEKYQFYQGYRTLWVFEKNTTMEAARKRLLEHPLFEQLNEFFLFKTIDEIYDASLPFFDHWKNLAGCIKKLYYI